jgi:G:T-mismatch repair DNA endonuclease (very short patch repair protein)
VAETLQHLTEIGWSGHIVAEINTRKSKNEEERLAALVETLEFAQLHTNQVAADPVASA